MVWVTNQCFTLNPSNTTVGINNIPGTSPRGVIEGPSTNRVDLSMMKNIRFTERFSAQIRAEAFNIFNHTNFRTVATNVALANFGTITAVRDPRTMQFGLKLMF